MLYKSTFYLLTYLTRNLAYLLYSKARYTLETKSNSTQSTLSKVDKVDCVALARTHWRHSSDKTHPLSTNPTELATILTATNCRIRLCRHCVRMSDKVDLISDSRLFRRFVAGFGDCRQCVPGLNMCSTKYQ